MSAMRELCKARYEAFGAAGNASKIRSRALDMMAQRYERGELDPQVH
jgi:fructose-bisphosphate aldolase class II